MISGAKQQILVAKRIIKDGMSVRATEQLVAKLAESSNGAKPKSKSKRSSAAVSELEERFRRALGTKVQLSLSKDGKGDLRISFFSQEELEKLLEILGA